MDPASARRHLDRLWRRGVEFLGCTYAVMGGAMTSVQLGPRFPVIPVRALANRAAEHFIEAQRNVIARYNQGEISRDTAQLEIEHFWAGALRRGVIDGDVETGSLMAGKSVGMVTREQSTAEIIHELVDQALAALTARERLAAAS